MASETQDAGPSPRRLPKAGDICQSCRPFWESQHKRARRLVAIEKRTDRHKIQIVVCPFCDGTPIIRNNGV